MEQFRYHVIRTARDGIDELDRQRVAAGYSQMKMAERADAPDVGQQYYRMWRSGSCSFPTYLRYLHALGYELVMVKKEELDAEGQGG